MLTHYGWLMVCSDINHPSIEKHDGHVYVHKDDVADGHTLAAGDVVSFYLYVDDKGLGAEECCVEQRAASQFNPSAVEFVPMAAKPMSANAKEFVPCWANQPIPAKDCGSCPVADVFARLSQVFMSDDEDSDEETCSVSTPDIESEEDTDSCYSGGSNGQRLLRHAPWKTRTKRASSLDSSTSAGSTSDSEDESLCDVPALTGGMWSFQRGRFLVTSRLPIDFRPPPGLTLLAGSVVADQPHGVSS